MDILPEDDSGVHGHRDEVLSDPDKQPQIVIEAAGIPEEMKHLRRWLCWRFAWNGKKWDKPPCSRRGRKGSSTDESTWCDFESALQGHQKMGFGIAFVLNGDGIIGIDLDDCRNPQTGAITRWAADIISQLATYAEVSPSDTGVKLLIRGTLPERFRKQFPRPDGGQVEVYSSGRYWAITGLKLPECPCDIRENQAGLDWLVATLPSWNVEKSKSFSEPNSTSTDDRKTALAALAVLDPNCGYSQWLEIGQALHAVDSAPAMLAVWDRWSRSSTKYIEGEPTRKWSTFRADGGITLATLCKYADDTARNWRPARDANARKSSADSDKRSENDRETDPCVTVTPVVDGFQPFPVDVLPRQVRRFVKVASSAIGCDPCFIALPMLVGCAAAIGNSRRIRLKHGWTEPSILWGAIIGYSGDSKSPALEASIRAIRERQRREFQKFETGLAERSADTTRGETNANCTTATMDDDAPNKPNESTPWRIVVDDVTIEAVSELLSLQPRGLLLSVDELAAWMGAFDRYKKSNASECAKWLEFHRGGLCLIDRKTGKQKSVCIPHASISVIGGIQPEILKRCLTEEHRANGLSARLLLAWPPRKPKKWSEISIDPEVEVFIEEMFDGLFSLEMERSDGFESEPKLLDLDEDAKSEFVRFFNEHAEEQSNLSGELCAVWSKLEAYAPRLALIHHLIRVACDEERKSLIDAQSMKAAITLVRWFAHEARRVYGMLNETREETQQRELVEWIKRRGGRTTVRDLMRGQARYRKSAELVRMELDALQKAGVGHWETTETGGRPLDEFVLNDQ